MKCPRCQSNKVDASGLCLTCGYEVSQWKKKLEQRLHAIRRKEEEIEQNLQSIIDAAVSRRPEYSSASEYSDAPSMPQPEELTFLEPDNDEPVLDLFVAVEDDTTDVSDAANVEYVVGSGHIVNAVDISNIEDTVDYESIAEDEGIVDDDDISYIDGIADDVGIADDDDITDNDKIAEDDGISDIAADNNAIEDDDITDDDNDADDEAIADNEDIVNDGRTVVPDTNNTLYPDDAGYFSKEADIQNVSDDETIADDDNDAKAGDSPYIFSAAIPEGRLIFLSRTLSSLVDLFLIALFTGVFLCMADYFTGAPMLNSINAISFSTLFLMIYFLYSIFFLATNGQTVGMIITDLRVASMNKKPLSLSQVVRRSASFLVSLFGLGIGLLTGVLNNECICLHDRLSETRVIRTI